MKGTGAGRKLNDHAILGTSHIIEARWLAKNIGKCYISTPIRL